MLTEQDRTCEAECLLHACYLFVWVVINDGGGHEVVTQGGNSISKSKFEGDEHLSAKSCGQIKQEQIKRRIFCFALFFMKIKSYSLLFLHLKLYKHFFK